MPPNTERKQDFDKRFLPSTSFGDETDTAKARDWVTNNRELLNKLLEPYILRNRELTELGDEISSYAQNVYERYGVEIQADEVPEMIFLDPEIINDTRIRKHFPSIAQDTRSAIHLPVHDKCLVIVGRDMATTTYLAAHEAGHGVGRVQYFLNMNHNDEPEYGSITGFSSVPYHETQPKLSRGLTMEEGMATWFGVSFLEQGNGLQITRIREDLRHRLQISTQVNVKDSLVYRNAVLNIVSPEYTAAYQLVTTLMKYDPQRLQSLLFTARRETQQRRQFMHVLAETLKDRQLAREVFQLPFETGPIYNFIDRMRAAHYQ
jgi:hypothetical protein